MLLSMLRPYQEQISDKALDILHRLKIVYLAMEVRTGKTLTALATAYKYGAKSVLFVTKKKAIPSILSDAEKLNMQNPYLLSVINYEQCKHHLNKPYDFIIIDESHNLKAFPKPSLRTKQIKFITQNKPLILLSGTPTPESYSELYHQFWISDYSPFAKYKNFYRFADDFVKVKQIQRGAYLTNDYSDCNYDKIKPIINPYIISYSQEDAGFICPVNESFHSVQIPNLYYHISSLERDKIIAINGEQIVADTPASLLTKMHQLCGGAVIGESKTIIYSLKKAEYIRDKFANKKIAIFYKFQAELEILKRVFKDYTIAESPEQFKEIPQSIYLAQIISGREGIALDCADAIVMYSIDFAAVSYWQARARLQTLNRTLPAEVHWVFAEGGIEQKIYRAVKNKKDFTLSFYYKS